MRILKFSAAAFLTVVAAGSLQAQSDSDIQSKARAALQQAEAQADAQQPAAPAKPAAPTKPTQPAPVAKTPPPPPPPAKMEIAPAPVAKTSSTLTPEAEARAREAIRQASANPDSSPKPVAAGSATKVTEPTQVKNSAPPTGWHQTATPPPVKTPETAATHAAGTAAISKKARLDDLLNKYKMDQIGPQEYFQQKAKILAEP